MRDTDAQDSHSQRGEYYDNVQAEILWSNLKTKLVEVREWPVAANLAGVKASVSSILTITTKTAATRTSAT